MEMMPNMEEGLLVITEELRDSFTMRTSLLSGTGRRSLNESTSDSHPRGKEAISKLIKSGVSVVKFSASTPSASFGDLNSLRAQAMFDRVQNEYRQLIRGKKNLCTDPAAVHDNLDWDVILKRFYEIKKQEEEDRQRKRDIEDGRIIPDEDNGSSSKSARSKSRRRASTAANDFAFAAASASTSTKNKYAPIKKLLTLKKRPPPIGEQQAPKKRGRPRVRKEIEDMLKTREEESESDDNDENNDGNSNDGDGGVFQTGSGRMMMRADSPESMASSDLDSSFE